MHYLKGVKIANFLFFSLGVIKSEGNMYIYIIAFCSTAKLYGVLNNLRYNLPNKKRV